MGKGGRKRAQITSQRPVEVTPRHPNGKFEGLCGCVQLEHIRIGLGVCICGSRGDEESF